ncbi:glycosyltransferase family 4 protein [Dictyobacter kobayashii]|uniref:Glycosyl transferase n=1 Tax=Dictyobacter kobayashii TaxID=2014872 RepID=A0A402AC76_9CHLR|nr:glycosyltransferase family 4 protein [Dictyobacter kobayashii]GCE16703.1 glycosyl transferase [Dictyobacter kobayashii]
MTLLRIAQIAPLGFRLPPLGYGGVERIVHQLTEQLVKKGHMVTLFACASSHTSANLVPVAPHPVLYHKGNKEEVRYYGKKQLEIARVLQNEFDIIHAHNAHFSPLIYQMAEQINKPTIVTLHHSPTHWESLAVDEKPETVVVERYYTDSALTIALSQSHKETFASTSIRWGPLIPNFLNLSDYTLSTQKREYLAFLGKLAPEKGPDKAIEVALRIGMKIKLAGPAFDSEYFKDKLQPFCNHPLVEFVGVLNDQQKSDFLGKAHALLFPVDWPEPFGLVMIEALACGTPVIALRSGAVPEIIKHGETGFICDSIDAMRNAFNNLQQIDRQKCRIAVENQYSALGVAEMYENLYQEIVT